MFCSPLKKHPIGDVFENIALMHARFLTISLYLLLLDFTRTNTHLNDIIMHSHKVFEMTFHRCPSDLMSDNLYKYTLDSSFFKYIRIY